MGMVSKSKPKFFKAILEFRFYLFFGVSSISCSLIDSLLVCLYFKCPEIVPQIHRGGFQIVDDKTRVIVTEERW